MNALKDKSQGVPQTYRLIDLLTPSSPHSVLGSNTFLILIDLLTSWSRSQEVNKSISLGVRDSNFLLFIGSNPPLANRRHLTFYPSMCSFSMKIITATFNNLSMIAPITLLRVTDYLKVTRLVTNCTLNGVVKYA